MIGIKVGLLIRDLAELLVVIDCEGRQGGSRAGHERLMSFDYER